MMQVLVSGVFVGMIYALFALGLVVVFNGSNRVNFAHGETGMIGTFTFSLLAFDRGWPVLGALLVGAVLSAGVGIATERLVARPLAGQSQLTTMLGSFGIAATLLVVASQSFGSGFRVQPPLVAGPGLTLGPVVVTRHQLAAGAIAIGLFVLVELLYRRTALGRDLRAIAMAPDAAHLIGLPVNASSVLTWGLAGALAFAAGVLIAPLVTMSIGFMTTLLVRGLSALVLGGFRSPVRVAGAAVAIALVEGMVQLHSAVAGLTELLLAAGIIVVLVLRPGHRSALREATS